MLGLILALAWMSLRGRAAHERTAAPEWLALAAVALAALSGLPALSLSRGSGAGERLAVALLALAAGAGSAARRLGAARPARAAWRSAWAVPGGTFAVRVDALSAMFLLQIFVIALLGADLRPRLLAPARRTRQRPEAASLLRPADRRAWRSS